MVMTRRRLVFFMVAGVIAGIAACSRPFDPGSQTSEARAVEGIRIVAPSDVGLRAEVLESVSSGAARDPHGDLESILVARNGCLVMEVYFNGANQDTLRDVRSVAKSLTSILFGIALHEAQIGSLDTSILRFFAGYAEDPISSEKAKITVRDLLEMRSGLDADDWRNSPESRGTESRMENAEDRLMFALHVPMANAPGEQWRYSSANTLILGRMLEVATGRDLEEYARDRLFGPLGFGRYEWRRDKQGHVVPQGNLLVRARDLLRLGLLLAAEGRWQGRQLVPDSWIKESVHPWSALPKDPDTGLGDLYKGYGYHWWTSTEPTPVGAVDLYFASGNGGNKLFIVPALQLVVVVTASAYNQRYAHRRSHGILRSILGAVAEEAVQLGR